MRSKIPEDNSSFPPEWIKLDHSAYIYPATMNRRLSAMFRLSVTLNETVDPNVLQNALNETMRRFPSFGYKLRKGLFWDYLARITETPNVQPDAINPMISIASDRKQRFLFRVRFHGPTIALETFHVLTDGTGALTFLLTLVSVYLHKQYGIPQKTGSHVLNVSEKPAKEELEDSFPLYRGTIGKLNRESRAYHGSGTLIASHLLNVITGIIPEEAIRSAAAEHHCSVTVFLASVMIAALQEQQEAEHRRKKPVRVSIPINLRTRFPSVTLRNFSYWMNPGINAQFGHYELEEIIRSVQAQSQLGLDQKELQARFTGTMIAANHPLFRLMPLVIKHWVLNLGDALMGDAPCSQSLSNLGSIDVPDSMKPYVDDIQFLMGRSRGKAGSGSCVSYNGKLMLTFTRKIHEPVFERLFFSMLVEMGIPVEIESNRLR